MKRWKKGMAWLLSVLCILVTVQIPSIPAKAATVINFDEKIAAQRAKFPAGKYWNHWVADKNKPDASNNPDGYTDHACTNHSGTGNPDCNLFDGARQCLGYAFKTYYDIYGQHYNADPQLKYESIGEIQVGDIVTVNTGGGYYGDDGKWHLNQHTIFVIGKNGDTLTVTECNALGDPCKIYWDTTYTVIGNTLKDNKYSGNVTYEFANGRHKPADVTFDTNQDPVGDVNEISCEGNKIYVRGWTYDPDTPNESLQVHIYVGQPAGTPGKNADIVINADKPSQDVTDIYGVGGNHRFEQSFETSYTGRQTVYIYAINSKSGNNPLIKQGTVDIIQPTSVYITDFGTGGKRGSVSDTNATLYATATTNARSGINIGVRIGTSSGNWDIANINGDELSAAGYNQLNSEGYFEMWYECNTELGKTLKPGTTYYYQFFVKVNGKEYSDSIKEFKTTGIGDNEKPTISNLQVIQKNRNGYILQCNVSDNVGVSKVEFSTCTEASGKTDWKTYTVTNLVNGVATCEIKTSDFGDREGRYFTDIYAYDTSDNKTEWAQENTYYTYIDRTNPVVVSAEITSFDKDGYTVTATATDNVGVTQIKFPSWSSGGTEDDIVWYEGSPVVNGTSTCRINVKDMKPGDGNFTTDIRAYDEDGNVSDITSINRLSIRIDNAVPSISDVLATKLSDLSYKVSCKVTDENLKSVQFGTSVNGKTTVWKDAVLVGDKYEATVDINDFAGEEGDYITTIKAVDTYGNESTKQTDSVTLSAKADIPLTGISLNKEELKLEKGASETLQVNYTPADTTDSKETLWSSSDHSVATVENGVVMAVGKGNALITARCGRYTATCKVSVSEKEVTPSPDPEEKPLEEIALNQTLLELEQGESESLTVSYKPEDTTDNKGIIWSSNDETVATVSDGVVTAVGKGTTVITAKVGKCEATCTVNVSEKQVQPSPSEDPTPTPSEKPSPEPSEDPTPTPSEKPSPEPSEDPTPTPSEKPSPEPSEDPTPTPSEKPSPSEEPTPAPSESPKPEVHPNVPAVKPVDQHTHSFSWTTVQKASTTQDGLEELRCSCGMVKERSTIPASQAYVNELYQNLGKAPENGEVSFDSGRIYTISDYLIKKLQERADVTTTITFEYNRTKYRMIIPAGVDYTEMLEDEDYFYGYFYFAQKVGAKVETL